MKIIMQGAYATKSGQHSRPLKFLVAVSKLTSGYMECKLPTRANTKLG